MNKRVHEIAKERGLTAKDVLARLKAAGVDVKAASSSVDEDLARRVLSNGGAGDAAGERTVQPEAARAKAPSPDPAAATAPSGTAPQAAEAATAATTATGGDGASAPAARPASAGE